MFRRRGFRPAEDNTRKTYEHDEIEIEYRGVKAKITKEGKVVFTKEHPIPDKPQEFEYEQIEVSANMIFRLTNLLNNTKKVKFEPTKEN